ncbi:amyloid beta A4 precursor protein-binding family B member 1-interacting protein isoform X2 [Ischnura elegans]|uniref:amyloid beta A4 precursor protein-binding family B member 1-interacting protein isoform X2 n=1 Tax=Ischnura elegans TaxID=197161 RepID=UPI001ED8B4C4|nr:amyloid beta A4 precursor protein-binding family B member 1-interacting protein isoform X2 [Ischnura elegans]
MANLEDSQDVDLDAILGELCALESQYDQAIARQDEDLPIIPTNRGPQNHTSLESLGRAQQGAPGGVGMGRQNSQHHHTHSRSSSDGTRMRSENSQEMEGLSRSDAGVARTDSPDNDSAFSDNLSMLSSESSASSGGSGGGGRVVDVISSSSSSSSGHKPRTSGGIMPQPDGLIDRRSHGLVGDDVDEASRAKAEKIRLALDKMREASVRKLFIKAFSSDGSAKSLLVDERMGAGQVARLLADKNHVRMEPKWALVEYLPHLHMERVYEDHEPLVENLMMWTNDSKNQIQFVERPDKYLRLFSHPEEFLLPQASSDHGREFDDDSRAALIEEFFSGNGGAPCVPDMEGPLWLKAESKKGWKRYHFVLRASGLYYWPKEKSSSSSLTHRPPSHQLVCLATFDVNEAYWGLGWKKKYKAPTEYCFAIKHPRLQQPKSTKYIKFLCAEDGPTLARWITGIRIAKHGRRILDNYRLLVDELAQEDLDALAHARSCSISSVALGSGNTGTPSPGRTPEDDFAPSEDISGQVTLRRRNHTIEQSRASSSGSSGCGSDAGSAGSSGTGGGSCTPAFESDFPGMGTIKRKPSLQPKLPLTSMTRQLKEVGEDASVVGSTNSHDRSSSEDGTCTLTRTPSTLSRLSSRYSNRSSSSTLESRPSALRPRQQPLQRPVERSPTPEEDPENLPLPPPPEIFQSTLSLVDSILPPPPPELLTGNATIEDDTPLPPPPADLPPLPATPPPLASCMMGTNTVRRAPRRISFGDEASRNASLSPTHNPLPPSPSSPHSPPVVPPHAPGRPVMVMPMVPVPSPPKRSDGTRLSTPPAPSTSHYAPSSLASCDPPAHEFLSDLQRVMRRKWQVAQKCKWDHTTTPHEVLGFRDPPPPVADYRETNVSNWVREHYGIPGESAVWMPADGSGGSATDPHHPRSRTSVQGGSMRKRPPPPPPKRSESTHLSTAPSRGSQ